MKALSSLLATALLATSCTTDQTPEERREAQRRRERADRIGNLVSDAGAHFGLSPLERAMLKNKAHKIAGSKDPLNTGLDELDKHPKIEQKAGEWLQEKRAGDVLDELERKNPELKVKADKWMMENPRAAEKFRELLK